MSPRLGAPPPHNHINTIIAYHYYMRLFLRVVCGLCVGGAPPRARPGARWTAVGVGQEAQPTAKTSETAVVAEQRETNHARGGRMPATAEQRRRGRRRGRRTRTQDDEAASADAPARDDEARPTQNRPRRFDYLLVVPYTIDMITRCHDTVPALPPHAAFSPPLLGHTLSGAL